MNPNTMQQEYGMSPEDASTSLGFMTNLMEQHLKQKQMEQMTMAPQQGDMGAEMPQGEEQMPAPEPQIDPEVLKNEIKGELVGEVKKDLKKMIKQELEGLLEEEDDKEVNNTETSE